MAMAALAMAIEDLLRGGKGMGMAMVAMAMAIAMAIAMGWGDQKR